MNAVYKDLKESLSSGRKPDITHVRAAFANYTARACEYGDKRQGGKYVRANFRRPTGGAHHTTPTAEDFYRLQAYLRAAQSHIAETLDAMELHLATDPDLLDVEGMKRAAYAVDTDTKPDCTVGPSGLPHLAPACSSLNMAITQAADCGLLPRDPGQPWRENKIEKPISTAEVQASKWQGKRLAVGTKVKVISSRHAEIDGKIGTVVRDGEHNKGLTRGMYCVSVKTRTGEHSAYYGRSELVEYTEPRSAPVEAVIAAAVAPVAASLEKMLDDATINTHAHADLDRAAGMTCSSNNDWGTCKCDSHPDWKFKVGDVVRVSGATQYAGQVGKVNGLRPDRSYPYSVSVDEAGDVSCIFVEQELTLEPTFKIGDRVRVRSNDSLNGKHGKITACIDFINVRLDGCVGSLGFKRQELEPEPQPVGPVQGGVNADLCPGESDMLSDGAATGCIDPLRPSGAV